MNFTAHEFHRHETKTPADKFRHQYFLLRKKAQHLLNVIKLVGLSPEMEEFEQRKLKIFNLMNFLQLIAGILIPVSGLLNASELPAGYWIVLSLPPLACLLVLYLNSRRKHELATITCFIVYPFVTSMIYMYGMNPGTTLFFILYGVLSVFFLRDTGYMIFSLSFSLVSYFLLAVVIRHYPYELYRVSDVHYFFNQVLALLFIFYGLYLIKKENTGYQAYILSKNNMLQEKNQEILHQTGRIRVHTERLKQQAAELRELNSLKNKMFSIISHDLKAPIYGLRNLFNNVREKKMTVTQLKNTVPEIQNELNYVVGMMDNLLQWAKSQMENNAVNPQKLNLNDSIREVLQLLNQQARLKQISISNETPVSAYSHGDKDMISLVLRNLVSNAIKFTPENGRIAVGVSEHDSFVEVYVKDSGTGISPEAMQKINSNNFYTTRGTASESGTGLGLMLCKEFLARNGSQLHIESRPGGGSIFSFSLLKSA